MNAGMALGFHDALLGTRRCGIVACDFQPAFMKQ